MDTTKKGIPLLNIDDVADITQVNKSLETIDKLLSETNTAETELLLRVNQEEITDNVVEFTRANTTIVGGCYDAENKVYYINDVQDSTTTKQKMK